MEEKNILETIIDLGNNRVDFNIKTDFIAEDFFRWQIGKGC